MAEMAGQRGANHGGSEIRWKRAFLGLSPPVGSPGQGVYRFKALSPGQTEITLKHLRSWEGDRSTIHRFALGLHIHANSVNPVGSLSDAFSPIGDKGRTVILETRAAMQAASSQKQWKTTQRNRDKAYV
jgi:hypothetical protein